MFSERRQTSGSCAKKFIGSLSLALTHTSAADVCCCIFLPLLPLPVPVRLPACQVVPMDIRDILISLWWCHWFFFTSLALQRASACVARYLSGSSVFYGMRAISYTVVNRSNPCRRSHAARWLMLCGDRRVAYVCLSRRRTLGHAALWQVSCLLRVASAFLPCACLDFQRTGAGRLIMSRSNLENTDKIENST